MYLKKTIGVVVPAYNEEKLIGKVISTMPEFVDKIIIVNDTSSDRTQEVVESYMEKYPNVVLINHKVNKGNGGSLITGYLRALDLKLDVIAVMDGDAQMDPSELASMVEPVCKGEVDYTKGNRLFDPDVKDIMPRYRLLGNAVLTLLTKFATGYWHLVDPQFSYTAISYKALKHINIGKMVLGFGYNADILNLLNIYGYKAIDVESRPIYGDEISNIKLTSYIPKISWILTKLFFRRLWRRYVVLDFHPLVLFYAFTFFNIIVILIPFTIRFFWVYSQTSEFPQTTFQIIIFTFLITFQSIIFAIWMDMDYNRMDRR